MSRAAGLALGYAADRLLADPRRGHPVAGFGAVAASLERRWWRDDRRTGAAYAGVLVGGAVALGLVAERTRRPLPHTVLTAVATWAVLGGTSLDREGAVIQRLLEEGRLDEGRMRLTHLVGRDTSQLSEAEVVRAAVESLAENTSDAVVAPLVWGAVAGMPGLLGYRAANTLDAMVGHRSARYERFGWAAARLDDVLNLPAIPAHGRAGRSPRRPLRRGPASLAPRRRRPPQPQRRPCRGRVRRRARHQAGWHQHLR